MSGQVKDEWHISHEIPLGTIVSVIIPMIIFVGSMFILYDDVSRQELRLDAVEESQQVTNGIRYEVSKHSVEIAALFESDERLRTSVSELVTKLEVMAVESRLTNNTLKEILEEIKTSRAERQRIENRIHGNRP